MADLSDDDSENLEKDERRDLELLQRIADALVEFYGLGEVPLLMVDDVDGHPTVMNGTPQLMANFTRANGG